MVTNNKKRILLQVIVFAVALTVSVVGSNYLPKLWLIIIPLVSGLLLTAYVHYKLGILFTLKYTDSVITARKKMAINFAFIIALSFIMFPLINLLVLLSL